MTVESNQARGGLAEALKGSAPIIVLAALCVWAYVDLKSDIAAIESLRAEAVPAVEPLHTEPEVEAAAPQPDPSPPVPAPPDQTPSPLPSPGATIEWECEGEIAHEKVIEAVGKHGQAVFDCYTKTLVDVPDLKGTLVLELNVGGAGEVREARVKGPVKEQALLACVSESVYGWTFQPPEGGECAVVSVPFLLDPADHGPKPPQ